MSEQRKRKMSEDLADKFNKFSDKITATINNWRAQISEDTSRINDSINTILKEDLADVNKTSQELKEEIVNIRKDYAEMKNFVNSLDSRHEELWSDINILQNSAQFCSDEQDRVKKSVELLSEDVKSIQILKEELSEVKQENAQLRSAINESEQRDRLLNLEILGVPEFKEEDLSEIVTLLARNAGVDLAAGDLTQVNRVSPRSKLQGRPRVIIAKMRTRLLRDNIISGTRKCRITTECLNLPGEAKPIFINEHLTVFNKILLKKCKEYAKTKDYQYVWPKNGRIFIRKNDTAPPIVISLEEDLFKKMV